MPTPPSPSPSPWPTPRPRPAPPRLGTARVWRGFARELTAPGSDLMDRVAGSFARVEGLEGADDVVRLNRNYMLRL